MTATPAKFDKLADDYDRYRPRYPTELLGQLLPWVAADGRLSVIDAGAGTGIVLDTLLPVLGERADVTAVDVSPDMVAQGERRHPSVRWVVAPAEDVIEQAACVDLVVAAQSYQWMQRPRFLRACRAALGPTGVLAVAQSNRDVGTSPFLDAYESLLERRSPGYRRDYRSFDIEAELSAVFPVTQASATTWARELSKPAFVGMARSSTQVQRALAAHGHAFLEELDYLLDQWFPDGPAVVAYRSELYIGAGGHRGVAPVP